MGCFVVSTWKCYLETSDEAVGCTGRLKQDLVASLRWYIGRGAFYEYMETVW